MTIGASVLGRPYGQTRAAKNNRADAATATAGSVVQWDPAVYDGISVRQPLGEAILDNIAGVLLMDIAYGDQRNQSLITEGRVRVKYKNHASAAIGTFATPVAGQDYLTYSPVPTRFMLLTTQTDGVAVHTQDEVPAPEVVILPVTPARAIGARVVTDHWEDPAAAAEDGVHAAITGSDSAIVTTTTGITNPDYPRNIVINPDGTVADVKACNITINGTDINDAVISEDIAVVENQAHDVLSSGLKAFKTVTSIVIPIQDGAAATFHIGTGDCLGLRHKLTRNTVLVAYLNDTLEGTAATVVVNATVISNNTADLNSALDGNAVDIIYVTTE